MERIGANSTHLHQPADKRLHEHRAQRSDGVKRLTNTPPSRLRRIFCRRTVKLALDAGNQAEAHAAIARAFEPEGDRITLESHVAELGISVRTVNYLTEAGIHTVEALANTKPETLLGVSGFGEAALKECQQALTQAIQNGLVDAA